jgi:hypothetical protein
MPTVGVTAYRLIWVIRAGRRTALVGGVRRGTACRERHAACTRSVSNRRLVFPSATDVRDPNHRMRATCDHRRLNEGLIVLTSGGSEPLDVD